MTTLVMKRALGCLVGLAAASENMRSHSPMISALQLSDSLIAAGGYSIADLATRFDLRAHNPDPSWALARVAPVALWAWPEGALYVGCLAEKQLMLTHPDDAAGLAAFELGLILGELVLHGGSRTSDQLLAVSCGDDRPTSHPRKGSCWDVLTKANTCLWETSSFAEAIALASTHGQEVALVTGQLAGACYGCDEVLGAVNWFMHDTVVIMEIGWQLVRSGMASNHLLKQGRGKARPATPVPPPISKSRRERTRRRLKRTVAAAASPPE